MEKKKEVEKAKIGERLWIGTLEKIRFGKVECGKLLHYKDTIHRRNKRPILRYFLTMMLM
ncbi:hypothetical protein T06_15578 [Trichinella sp. T6]|nr:hypothetical protein T06_15578 [Trichinella sp. T6]